MSGVATVPAITGPLFDYMIEAGTAIKWDKTGSEYTAYSDFHLARLIGWGVEVPARPPRAESAAVRAARLASQRSYAVSAVVAPVELTGNLVADVRTLTGLTNQQIADVTGVSERRVAGWRQRGDIPTERRRILEALRAVGLTLYGGLGAQGTARWLVAGRPSPLEQLKAGDADSVASRLYSIQDSPAA